MPDNRDMDVDVDALEYKIGYVPDLKEKLEYLINERGDRRLKKRVHFDERASRRA